MAFKFNCPSCGTAMIGTDDGVGRDTKCPSCHAVFAVPEPPLFERGEPYPEEDERPRTRRPARSDDYDDEPRPRPRRRRRPPLPPPGPGPLFWIAIILGICLLGTCTCCGGGYLLIPGENWQRQESGAGAFSVEVPGPLEKDLSAPGVKPDPNVKIEGTVLLKRLETYVVTYTDLPPARERGMTDDALLEEVVRELKKESEIKRIVRNDPIKVAGLTARELEYIDEDGGTYIMRLIVADRRMYVLVAGGPFTRPGNANVRRFLESFKITGQAPVGGGKFNR